MNYKIVTYSSVIALLSGSSCYSQIKENNTTHLNILFICVDDLRCELGCLGSSVKTPNIDKLAGEGYLFFNHYVQVPTSGASRASMLTGKYPHTRKDLSNEACRLRLSDRKESVEPETMFHHLRRNGYYTVGIGKISHYPDGYLYGYTEKKSEKLELPYSWDEMLFDAGKWGTGWNAFFGYADGSNRQSRHKKVKPYECADVIDEAYPDGLTANLAIKKLQELASSNKTFCLAVGFFKPHLPFTAPKRYWDLYVEDSISLTPVPFAPTGCCKDGLHNSDEFNGYLLGDEKASLFINISNGYARKLRHAYFACISYIDAQIGKLIGALEETGLSDNTIVILWGDHGWHLGDHTIWGKHTLYNCSLNSPLIIKVPSGESAIKCGRIVSSVDIYPTLMELCDIVPPVGLEGNSLGSLLKNPNSKDWKDISIGFWNTGISVRNSKYRLISYRNNKSGVECKELYQYCNNNRFEMDNILGCDTIVDKKMSSLLQGINLLLDED